MPGSAGIRAELESAPGPAWMYSAFGLSASIRRSVRAIGRAVTVLRVTHPPPPPFGFLIRAVGQNPFRFESCCYAGRLLACSR